MFKKIASTFLSLLLFSSLSMPVDSSTRNFKILHTSQLKYINKRTAIRIDHFIVNPHKVKVHLSQTNNKLSSLRSLAKGSDLAINGSFFRVDRGMVIGLAIQDGKSGRVHS